MIAAVAAYDDGRMAPALDFAPELRLYELDSSGSPRLLETLKGFQGGRESLMAGALESRGVGCVVCGGISRPMLWMLAEAGMTVYPGTFGSVEQALAGLVGGSLQPMTPGGWRRRGRRGGRGRGRGGRRGGRRANNRGKGPGR